VCATARSGVLLSAWGIVQVPSFPSDIGMCVVLHCSNVLLRRRDDYELVNKRAQCRNYHQWRKSADASLVQLAEGGPRELR